MDEEKTNPAYGKGLDDWDGNSQVHWSGEGGDTFGQPEVRLDAGNVSASNYPIQLGAALGPRGMSSEPHGTLFGQQRGLPSGMPPGQREGQPPSAGQISHDNTKENEEDAPWSFEETMHLIKLMRAEYLDQTTEASFNRQLLVVTPSTGPTAGRASGSSRKRKRKNKKAPTLAHMIEKQMEKQFALKMEQLERSYSLANRIAESRIKNFEAYVESRRKNCEAFVRFTDAFAKLTDAICQHLQHHQQQGTFLRQDRIMILIVQVVLIAVEGFRRFQEFNTIQPGMFQSMLGPSGMLQTLLIDEEDDALFNQQIQSLIMVGEALGEI